MREKLKAFGQLALGFIFLCAFLTLVIMFFYGAAWVGEKVIPVLELIVGSGFLILLVIGTPLAFFRKTRYVTGLGWFYWSYALGLLLWISCLLATMQLWGAMAAIIGMIFLGVGVFVTGVLAAMFHGEWSFVGQSF